MAKLTTQERQLQLGLALRQRRINARLTQQDLARQAGVARFTVQNLELGRGTVESLIKIVRSLGITDWLDQLAPPPPQVSPIEVLKEQERIAKQQLRKRVVRVRNPVAKSAK